MKNINSRFALALPLLAGIAAIAALVFWWAHSVQDALSERLPGSDETPGAASATSINPILAGKLIPGRGQTVEFPGLWPQFRGPNRDGVSLDTTPLSRSWGVGGPPRLWTVECGEGYAAPAIRGGRAYLMDYDYAKKQNALRCLSLEDGSEIWRYAYPLPVKRNHGMTRTIPAIAGKFVVAMDPKCNLLCVDADSGALRWGLNLVQQFGTTVPPWYAGQCPLIDENKVILAPGGGGALLAAVALDTGRVLWQTPNPHGWKMTHSSVMPMEFGGRKLYLYCGSGGVVGVSAMDGRLLWETAAWKISIATVPSPLVLQDGKILLAGGYDAGCMLLQLQDQDGKLTPVVLWKLPTEVFGATQHTPIFHNGQIYGVRPDGQFACLGLDGKILWTSPPGDSFGLGSFLFANGLIYLMNDSGKLSLLEDSTGGYKLLAQAQVLTGRESWGPMAEVGGRLLVRDFTRLACLDVASSAASK